MTWPVDRAPVGEAEIYDGAPLSEPIPIPVGRGRWRFALHERQFGDRDPRETLISEIVGARGIRLETQWNRPAKLTLTLDGHHDTTALIRELQTDIFAWRWDEWAGIDRCMFRGLVTQSLDQLTQQAYTVNFTCHDYSKMLERRLLTNSFFVEQVDQDSIILGLIDRAKVVQSSSGISFSPGSYLPVEVVFVAPDGTPRGSSGILRDRNYAAQSNIGELLDNLANVIGGFDYDILPGAAAPGGILPHDTLRIFYPYKGVVRDTPLVYGTTISGMTRSANAADYANYWRTLGHNLENPDEAQLFAEDWNADSNDVNRIAVGTWMAGDNAADVSELATLQEKASGQLATYGQLIPSFTLTLRPGAYMYGRADIGDVLPIVIQEGRLDIKDVGVRVLGVAFAVGIDGEEDTEVDVGRPTASLFQMLTRADKDVDALTRRETAPQGVDTPVGTVIGWAGPNVPDVTWMFCQGQQLSRTTYPELFDVIGYTWGGAGDIYTLPDSRGRVVVGAGQGNGLTNRVIGTYGGGEVVGLGVGELPTHSHGVTVNNEAGHVHGTNAANATHNHPVANNTHSHPYQQAFGTTFGGLENGPQQLLTNTTSQPSGDSTHGHTTTDVAANHGHGNTLGGAAHGHGASSANAGGGGAHQNMQPYLVMPQIIRVIPPARTVRKRRFL